MALTLAKNFIGRKLDLRPLPPPGGIPSNNSREENITENTLEETSPSNSRNETSSIEDDFSVLEQAAKLISRFHSISKSNAMSSQVESKAASKLLQTILDKMDGFEGRIKSSQDKTDSLRLKVNAMEKENKDLREKVMVAEAQASSIPEATHMDLSCKLDYFQNELEKEMGRRITAELEIAKIKKGENNQSVDDLEDIAEEISPTLSMSSSKDSFSPSTSNLPSFVSRPPIFLPSPPTSGVMESFTFPTASRSRSSSPSASSLPSVFEYDTRGDVYDFVVDSVDNPVPLLRNRSPIVEDSDDNNSEPDSDSTYHSPLKKPRKFYSGQSFFHRKALRMKIKIKKPVPMSKYLKQVKKQGTSTSYWTPTLKKVKTRMTRNSLGTAKTEQDLINQTVMGQPSIDPDPQPGPSYTSLFSTPSPVLNEVPTETRKEPRNGKLKPYMCDLCGKSYGDKGSVPRHKRKAHGLGIIFTCRYANCKKEFDSREELLCHKQEVHVDTPLPPGPPYPCPTCDKLFQTEASFKHHQVVHTRNLKPIHQCDLCDKKFFWKGNIHKHKKTVHFARPWKCELCPERNSLQTFKSEEEFQKHLETHSTNIKRYRCKVCSKRFATVSKRIIHEKTVHMKNNVFKCSRPNCGKSFNRKDHLKWHLLEHEGKLDFQCRHCGKGFPGWRQCINHENSAHWRDKSKKLGNSSIKRRIRDEDMKCKTCGTEFTSKYALRAHQIIHLEARPFQCGECEKSFKKNGWLKIHVKKYHSRAIITPSQS